MDTLVQVVLGVLQGLVLFVVAWGAREFRRRTLDPSEVKTLQAWAPKLAVLDASINNLQATLHENGLDRAEVRRIRSFFFGTEQRGSELHELRNAITDAKLSGDRLVTRVEALEHERRESNRRLDQRLDRIEAAQIDILKTVTDALNRLPTNGIRGTPPGGARLPEDDD